MNRREKEPIDFVSYFQGKDISSKEDLIIERHAARESFAGVCEDVRIGVSVIFYLQNAAKYKKEMLLGHLLSDKISTSFSGLSLKGKILFPVQKAEPRVTATGSDSANQRHKMIAAARQGDAVVLIICFIKSFAPLQSEKCCQIATFAF